MGNKIIYQGPISNWLHEAQSQGILCFHSLMEIVPLSLDLASWSPHLANVSSMLPVLTTRSYFETSV